MKRKRDDIYCLATEYFKDRLGLRGEKIEHCRFSTKRDYIGCAKGNWNDNGELIGGLGIEVKYLDDLYVELLTLAHELCHIRQYVDGTVKFTKGSNRLYAGVPDHYQYGKRATEREVVKHSKLLVSNFINMHYNEFNILNKINVVFYNLIKRRLGEV